MKVGFIGTGNMGNPMTRHLIKAGHDVTVNDQRPEAAANLVELGATWADSPSEVAPRSDFVFTSLPGPPQVDQVVLGDDGLLAGARPGMIHIDLSTNSPSAVRRIAQMEAAKGVAFLDAPVAGLVIGATNGTLTIFVGGDEKTLEAARPLLETFGENIFHCGPTGSGAILKLTNNVMTTGSGLLVQEALALGVKAGIPAERLYEIWNKATSTRYVQGVPNLLKRDFDTAPFTLALAGKDIALAVEAGRELGVPMRIAAAASQVYVSGVARGYGDKVMQATMLVIEEDAGIKIE
jgi:3-hydroxyisobutyrate dehydrogenase-like beta-hydroxyacid dehydrogenase